MKEIKAVIRPQRLSRIRETLRHIPGFPGLTATRVEGFSRVEPGSRPSGIKYELTEYSPHIRVEILAPDEMVEAIVAAICECGHTGQRGDGLVWVTPVEQLKRIRGE